MPAALRFLVAESETPEQREERRASIGRSSGESYADTLRAMSPGAECTLVRPAEEGVEAQDAEELSGFDAVFLTGSPLHVYDDSPDVQRQLRFMRAVFTSGTPSFGSCAGLQVAVAAAGGTVRANKRGHEAGFARRIVPTEAGRTHKLLAGRPAAWDAPSIHSDEVERLPGGATLLASNAVTAVQAAEVVSGRGIFWGVQYHPELTLAEIAAALTRQARELVEGGLARTEAELADHAALVDALDKQPDRRDLAWRLGLNKEVTDPVHRQTEMRNFIEHLAMPTFLARRRTGPTRQSSVPVSGTASSGMELPAAAAPP